MGRTQKKEFKIFKKKGEEEEERGGGGGEGDDVIGDGVIIGWGSKKITYKKKERKEFVLKIFLKEKGEEGDEGCDRAEYCR
jgi:hypothetical protein